MEQEQILTICAQLNIKLQEILDRIHTILKYLEKEKMNVFIDSKIVLACHLHRLAGNITV